MPRACFETLPYPPHAAVRIPPKRPGSLRIALIPSAYLPMVGGVEELTGRLARHLAAGGDAVEVWTPLVDATTPDDEEVHGIRVRRFPMPMPPARVGPILRLPGRAGGTFLRLLRAVRQFRPDVLHVQCFGVNGAYATVLSALTRIPLVVTLQGETVMDDDDIYSKAASLRGALRLGLRRASAVTGCSQFVLDDAATRFGLTPGRGQVIFNGVDRVEAEPCPVPVPFERFVACLGRVVPKKGFDLAIEAFRYVAERVPGVGLVIAGAGACRPDLETLADRLGLRARVHFTGSLGRPQVEWVMRNAEVFLMPSRVEPFGIVVLEAWRARRPVIVSAFGGAPEFVRDGVDGLVVDPTDTPRLAEAVTRLLEDRSSGERLAASGAERVKRFDWRLITAEYRHVYEQAAGSPPARYLQGDAVADPDPGP